MNIDFISYDGCVHNTFKCQLAQPTLIITMKIAVVMFAIISSTIYISEGIMCVSVA